MATERRSEGRQLLLPIFVSAPDLGIPTQTLNLNPNHPIHLPKSILPRSIDPSSFYLTSNGRPLSSLSTLRPFSTVTLHLRVRGGGGDGGATGAESRDCYLNMYAVKKPDKVDPNETRLSKWTTCSLSFEPLAAPVVIDRLGNVFNKERLLEALLEKKIPKEFGHIRGMKDMIPVELQEIKGSEGCETRFQCPITGLEFNGKYPFFAIRGCGHVVSMKALKEVKTSLASCVVCNREFGEVDKIVLNGSEEEVKVLRERMEEERGKVKEKKEKNGVLGVKRPAREEKGGKRFKAVDIAPVHANKEVYASIFTSSKKKELKETYMCRSLPLGRN